MDIWPVIVLHGTCQPEPIKLYKEPWESAIIFSNGLILINTMLFESCPIWCMKISKTDIIRHQKVKDFIIFFNVKPPYKSCRSPSPPKAYKRITTFFILIWQLGNVKQLISFHYFMLLLTTLFVRLGTILPFDGQLLTKRKCWFHRLFRLEKGLYNCRKITIFYCAPPSLHKKGREARTPLCSYFYLFLSGIDCPKNELLFVLPISIIIYEIFHLLSRKRPRIPMSPATN